MKTEVLKLSSKINLRIANFNKYMSPKHPIKIIDVAQIDDANVFVKVIHNNWDSFSWPNPNSRGIYILFSHNYETKKIDSLYIGKAMFTSTIGKRLYTHLMNNKKDTDFLMKDKNGLDYRIDCIYSIPIDDMSFISSAVEAYLIENLSGDVNLLNAVGNTD